MPGFPQKDPCVYDRYYQCLPAHCLSFASFPSCFISLRTFHVFFPLFFYFILCWFQHFLMLRLMFEQFFFCIYFPNILFTSLNVFL